MVEPYRRTGSTTALKNLRLRSSDKDDFHINDNLSTASHAFPIRILMSLAVDEISLPRYINLSVSNQWTIIQAFDNP